MKSLILALCLVGVAHANTLVPLNVPPAPLANVHTQSCSGAAFTSDGQHVTGTCAYSYGSSCGRYCHSAMVEYAATWDLSGSPTLGSECATAPSGRKTTTTYLDGYSSATCNVSFWSPTVVQVGWTYLYYQSTSITGDELVCSNAACYIDEMN